MHCFAVRACVCVSQGCNTAVSAARLSLSPSSVRFACQLGADSHRPMLLASLHSAGLDTSLAHTVSDAPTGAAYIFCLPGGDNSIVLQGGANHAWSLPLSSPLRAAIRSAGCVLLQREVPDAVNDAVANECGGHRKLLLDVGGSTAALSPQLLAATLFLAPNETELSGLSGLPTDTEQHIVAAAMHALRTLSVGYLLCTVGDRGCYLFPAPPAASASRVAYSYLRCPAFPIRPVDSTGAGDTFRGAFAVSYNELSSAHAANSSPTHQPPPLSALSASLVFASAAAALCCLHKGTLPAMPDRQQVHQFMKQHAHVAAVEETADARSADSQAQSAAPNSTPSAVHSLTALASSASSSSTPQRAVASPLLPRPTSSSSSLSGVDVLSPLLSPVLSSASAASVPPKRHRSLSTADVSDDRLHVIAQSFALILQALGEDPSRAGLAATPMRAAKALAYFTKGYETDLLSIVNAAIFAESQSAHNPLHI